MKLKDILRNVSYNLISGSIEKEVKKTVFDSRLADENSIFFAIKGTNSDGHDFIPKVIEQGCKIIVCQNPILNSEITQIQVENSAKTLGICASNFYGNPSSKLKLVGITGTNGKTTCVTLLHKLFQELGYKVGLLSTVVNKINESEIPSTHTTPNPVELNKLLAEMVNQNCEYCFMEVSSHAVVQERIAGLTFKGAVFTNITHDHLDYHGTFKEYIKAKKYIL
jgi:UDP-N-acetylmuramoyl-L-alanyl-D-glutamate--2,6-diaminopimelate ligase